MSVLDKPLPIPKLKKRYSKLLSPVKDGRTGSIVEVPKSAFTGYLKYLIQNRKNLQQIVDISVCPVLIEKFENENDFLSLLIEKTNRRTSKENTFTISVEKFLKAVSNIKLVLFIVNVEKFDNLKLETIRNIKYLLDKLRENGHSIYFLSNYRPCFYENKTFQNQLYALASNTINYFPTLDFEEFIFTVRRLYKENNKDIKDINLEALFRETGGVYYLTRQICNIDKDEETLDISTKVLLNLLPVNQIEDILKNNKNIYLEGLCFTKSGIISSTLIKDAFNSRKQFLALKNLENLTYKERLILNELKANQKITHDRISQILWGDNSTEKYSELAIRKYISRLRKKCISELKIKSNHKNVYECSPIGITD